MTLYLTHPIDKKITDMAADEIAQYLAVGRLSRVSAKVSCTVLRGGESGDARTLPDTLNRAAKKPSELFGGSFPRKRRATS